MKNTIKLLCLFLISLVNCEYIQAKNNFASGFIIKTSGDTLRGQIEYKNWNFNPQKIKFKASLEFEITEYSPMDIVAFSVSGEIYKSAIVKVDSSTVNKFSETPQFEFRVDTTFLQMIFQGNKSLYLYKDKFNQNNFYIYDNSQYVLLEHKKYIRKDYKDKEYLASNNRYIGQLRVYLENFKNIDKYLTGIEYKSKKIEKVFENYYKTNFVKSYKSRPVEKIKAEYGIVAGVNMIDLGFKTSSLSFYPLPEADFDNSLNFSGGLFFNIVLPRNNEKWSIYNELFYTKYNTSAVFNNYQNDNRYEIHNYNVGYSYLKLNNMLRYKFPIGNVSCFVNGGISSGLIVDEVNVDNVYRKYNNTITTSSHPIFYDGPNLNVFESYKYEQGLLFGLGATYKQFSLELRKENGTGFTNYVNLTTDADRYYLLFSYRF